MIRGKRKWFVLFAVIVALAAYLIVLQRNAHESNLRTLQLSDDGRSSTRSKSSSLSRM